MMAIFTDAIVYLCSVWILTLYWNIAGVYSQLDVQFDVHDVVALRKESASMTCKISGQDANGNATWFKHRKPIEDKNIQMFANGTLYFPVVRDKETLSDSGIYQCCLRINSSYICSNDVQLSIAVMPKLSRVRYNPRYEVGQAARLTCPAGEANPLPKITWYKDKQEIVPDGDRVTVLSSGILHLVSLRLDQAARYRCQASNIAGKRNGSIITLNVTPTETPLGLPVTIWGPRDVRIPVGGQVELECLMQGPLNMIVTWTREDGKSLRNPNFTGMMNLHLINVTPEDAGMYTCTARTPGIANVVSVSATVVVISLPIIGTGPENSSMMMRLNKRLYCSVQADSATTVTWYKDGELSRGFVDPVTNDLVLNNLKFDDAGIYQCLATNEAGSVQKSARLEVWSVATLPTPPYSLQGVSLSSFEIMVMWLVDEHLQNTIIATTIHVQPVDGGQRSGRSTVLAQPTKTYIVTDLKPYTNYSIYLEVFTAQSSSLPSRTIYVVTNEAEPARYPDFRLSSSHPLRIDVSWEPIAKDQCNGVITNYKIVYKHSSTSPKEIIVNATELRATITGLQPDTQYIIQMAAATKEGYGPFSDWTQFRTIDKLTAVSPDVQFYNLTNSSVTLRWKEPGFIDIKGFNLTVSLSNQDKVLLQYELPPQTQEYVINALQPNTEYIICVSVLNSSGIGSPSVLHVTTKKTISTSVNPSRLPWPRDISVRIIYYNSFVVQWKAPLTALHVSKYRLRYQLNMDPWEYMVVNKVSGEDQQTAITNLQPFMWYNFALQSIGNGVESGYSELYTVQTKADKPQTPPSHLRAKGIDAHSVQISWEPPQKPNGIIIVYIILYNLNNTSPEQQWDTQQRNGSEKLSNVNNLRPNTEYFFRMKAKNNIGMSPPTDVVSARTLVASEPGGSNAGVPRSHGILLGIGVSIPCIVACIILLLLRKRLLGNGNRQVVRHKIENMRREDGSHQTAVTVTSAQPSVAANYKHLMFQNGNRQFGNGVPCNSNGDTGSMNNDNDADDEVPLSVRLLSGEFDNDPQLQEESAREVDPMLPRADESTTDKRIEDVVENEPQLYPLVVNSLNTTEGVQTDDESSLEMQTTNEVDVDISSGREANTFV